MIRLFTERHGAFWFMEPALAENSNLFAGNLRNLQEELNRSEDEYIQEHFRKYYDPPMPPVWKTMEVASMGTLSKLYSNMNDSAAKRPSAVVLPSQSLSICVVGCAVLLSFVISVPTMLVFGMLL